MVERRVATSNPGAWKHMLGFSGMLLAFGVFLFGCLEVNTPASKLDERPHPVSVRGFNVSGMPIRIESASVTRSHAVPEVSLTVSNLSGERVKKLQVVLFIFDSKGELKAKEDFPKRVDFGLNQYINLSYLPTGALAEGDRAVVSLQQVFGKSGMWGVSQSDLEGAVASFIRDEQPKPVVVTYTDNLAVTDADKAEVQALSLQHVLQNKEFVDFLSIKDPKKINLLSQNVELSTVKYLPGTQVNVLSLSEIKDKANRDGEIYYFAFTYLNFEGTAAQVAVSYEYKVREYTNHTPCCGYVTLKLSKDTGNWRIVEAAIAGR